jgi:two-component system, NtrC family, sensor kinase
MGRGPKPTKGKAKPAGSRRSPKNEDSKVRDLEKRLAGALGQLQTRDRELGEALKREAAALEQQTATSEILRVISNSPTDIQPVVDSIAAKALDLCEAKTGAVFRFDGELIHVVAAHSFSPEAVEAHRQTYPIPPGRGGTTARAILSRAVVYIPDIREDSEYEHQALAKATDYLSALSVPMLHESEPVGAITVTRAEAGAFSQRQIELLKTFADQAVIAIENVRLFNETKAALERQTATSEILRVISSSVNDLKPVFATILASAAQLCGAHRGALLLFKNGLFETGAELGAPAGLSEIRKAPYRPHPDTVIGRMLAARRAFYKADLLTDKLYREGEPRTVAAVEGGSRSLLAVPLLKDGTVIGAITIHRPEAGPFSDDHIALLQTFADQAVIAIENVRLFNETKEALDQQTATGEILRVISQSPTDVQPVFDAIVWSGARLCEADYGFFARYDGTSMSLVAHSGATGQEIESVLRVYPMAPTPDSLGGRTILERAVVHIPDVRSDPTYGQRVIQDAGWRTGLGVPLLREGAAIGLVGMWRRDVRPFSDRQIELLKTFADQAVIAIENVRLFTELQGKNKALTQAHAQVSDALDQQTATSEILQTIAQAPTDVQPVFDTIVRSAARLCHAHTTAVFLTDGRMVYRPAGYGSSPEVMAAMQARFPRPLDRQTMAGTAILTRSVVHVPDAEDPTAVEFVRQTGRAGGFRSLLSVPMLRQGEAVGAINVTRREPGPFPAAAVALLQAFADQAVIALENVRLFKELQAANRELAAASQHKSEFLANMSHELRTPLNAIIGFSEVLSEKMFGELNEKQEEYSKDIHASGQHLLSLINDILDLSKIEAGRMELELSDFHLPTALDSALTLVRERAGRRSIALQLSVDERLGQIQADERKVRQVVLNLLSNAIKFTPEGGRIEVLAAPKGGVVEVSVTDTGVGIAPEDQEAVFEEFRQVGTADKKVEGTGLGLTLCRKFVALQGGRIWVKSQLGAGSTFTFTIPNGK